MGIALLTFADLFADVITPLQSLAGRCLSLRRTPHLQHDAGLRYVAVRPSRAVRGETSGAGASSTGNAPIRPLRVVRMVDPEAPGRATGRVVISGRMADVCAELDRLAALESRGNPVSSHHIH